MEYADVKGLDVFSKQVIPIIFNAKAKDKSKRQMVIYTTQAGLQAMAARCGDYRPAETEPLFTFEDWWLAREEHQKEARRIFNRKEREARLKEIDENFPADPTNPFGIEKCIVTLHKKDPQDGKWYPVNGWARWRDYAPIKTDTMAYEMIATGETWPDGNPKKIKRLKAGIDITKFQTLDDTGLWPKMGPVMIAKCANSVALRAGWPATFSGVHCEEEFDRAKVLDLTASEMVEADQVEQRQKAVAMAKDEFPYSDHEGNLIFVPAGKFVDHMLREASVFTTKEQVGDLKDRNREGLRRFWAAHKNDALELNKSLEAFENRLPAQDKALAEMPS
jgi:phage recombination protein Bet